ncbi:hypothetical protein TRICI_004967 [Trichomonascus ciferrii]|uniref:Hsp70 nucleotide exchange factor FES1 n=1 Tax=Trichomonascus ciferrii TaxID=44093 RepID=A0A642UXX8_9ASCO|nr:hypothetical protein TRICI_004967 [Trichomonascus ciferrii]
MEKLLKWTAEAQGYDPSSGKEMPKPDPKLMAELLGAPDEATQMKDALAAACNKEQIDVANRETALDNLEMLVESMDNANNLESMGMWPALLGLLDDEAETIRKMALWVVGTAVQNNPTSQKNLVAKPGAIEKVLGLLNDADKEVRLKAMYALTSALGHCEDAYREFERSNGWDTLKDVMKIEDKKTQLKSLGLVQSAVYIEPVAEKTAKLKATGLVTEIIAVLETTSEPEVQEKALSLCSLLAEVKYNFSEDEKTKIKAQREQIIKTSDGALSNADFPFYD